MASTRRVWEVLKTHYCEHIQEEVQLEAQMVHPVGLQSDQPVRVTAHRCSHGILCNFEDKPACVWAGTNPAIDPFEE